MAIFPDKNRPDKRREDARAAAENLAVAALSYIVADEELLHRFFAETGLDPGSLREASKSLNFYGFILEFICANDETVLGLAAQENIRPEKVVSAGQLLAGPKVWDSP